MISFRFFTFAFYTVANFYRHWIKLCGAHDSCNFFSSSFSSFIFFLCVCVLYIEKNSHSKKETTFLNWFSLLYSSLSLNENCIHKIILNENEREIPKCVTQAMIANGGILKCSKSTKRVTRMHSILIDWRQKFLPPLKARRTRIVGRNRKHLIKKKIEGTK